MHKLLIANWKMNLSLQDAELFCMKLRGIERDEFLLPVVAAPFIYLGYLVQKFPNISFASQDVSVVTENYGAFTGEISAKMLRDLKINYSVIGHSERRARFNETSRDIKQKAINCINNSITPIICIGENSQTKENNNVIEYLTAELLNSVPETEEKIIIAYEPVWAIGSGASVTKEDLEEVVGHIADITSKVAKNCQIVYGGSVRAENARQFSLVKKLAGLLVGGASLDFDKFIKIVKSYA